MDKAPSEQKGLDPEIKAVRPIRSRTRSRSLRPVDAPMAKTEAPLYAAIDLGTNNCRMMIASFANGQFRIIEAYSKIVRLGEDLSLSGQISPAAQARALAALRQCAEKLAKRPIKQLKAVATAACRVARNGKSFIRRVEAETGLKLSIISTEEEARLSVAGCASLLDTPAKVAIVMDVGGGSTEMSWIDLSQAKGLRSGPPPSGPHSSGLVPSPSLRVSRYIPRPRFWYSIPKGVVNLAERFPEAPGQAPRVWFETMVEDVRQSLLGFKDAELFAEAFAKDEAYIIGTSGAITSLAGMHLGLHRYDRSKVDGLWISHEECRAVIDRLLELGPQGREREPCIGKDRSDLVMAGAAILEAVQSLWPCSRLRVADRGLREGLLLSMVKKKNRRRRRAKTPHSRPQGTAIPET